MRRSSLSVLGVIGFLTLAGTALPSLAANRSDPAWRNAHAVTLAPTQGGDCTTPVAFSSLPYTDSGNTCNAPAANLVTSYGSVCNTNLPFPYPGPEVVYQFTTTAGNSVAFSMSLTGSTGDLALFVISGVCNAGANCVASSQDAIGIGAGPETIAAAPYTAGTYFVHVDSYYGSPDDGNCGTYTLNATGNLPVELNGFTVD
ncbi:MAG: PPC domain-containing protein [Holophagales bacterium]|nr:PPC domain-containing protein [Holophagales bacterium]MBK9965702.1 PPC domain-containing protein [Holophagales bacterium]